MSQGMDHQETMRRHFRRAREGGVGRIVGWTFVGVIVAVFFALVFGLVVKALWNWIMPTVFGMAVITYWQAFGIIILSKILFSGMHPHSGHDRHKPPFVRSQNSYDRWWREKGQAAYDSWALDQANGNSPAGDGAR